MLPSYSGVQAAVRSQAWVAKWLRERPQVFLFASSAAWAPSGRCASMCWSGHAESREKVSTWGDIIGGVAQMVERLLSMQEAQGSIPCSSTAFLFFCRVSVLPQQNCDKKVTCLDRGSNTGPLDLQSNALPTELSKRCCTGQVPRPYLTEHQHGGIV